MYLDVDWLLIFLWDKPVVPSFVILLLLFDQNSTKIEGDSLTVVITTSRPIWATFVLSDALTVS